MRYEYPGACWFHRRHPSSNQRHLQIGEPPAVTLLRTNNGPACLKGRSQSENPREPACPFAERFKRYPYTVEWPINVIDRASICVPQVDLCPARSDEQSATADLTFCEDPRVHGEGKYDGPRSLPKT